jgi:large subunit ribosomal protein L10
VLTRAEKEEQVASLREKFGRATSLFIADYRGLTVGAVNELRGKLRSDGKGDVEYRVVKNSLLKLATADSELSVLQEHFVGPTAIAISYGDPAVLAKTLVEYGKANDPFDLKGAFLDGRSLDEGDVTTLATLPSLDGLRSQLVGLIQAPATKLVRLLAEPGAQLARVVEARRAELEDAG